MSNILIIKHGSLGDLIQANGAINDIKNNFPTEKILLLTTPPYADFMYSCPYLDGVLIDKRLPRWNIFYLYKLKKMIDRFNFTKVFDLQNSSRTRFYKKFFFKKDIFWSDSRSFSSKEKILQEINLPVLERMGHQLERAGIKEIKFTKKPNLKWSIKNISNIINQNFDGKYILIFPFCSPKLVKKKWPYFKDLIKIIKRDYGNKYNIAVAPGPNEIDEAKNLKIDIILNKGNALNISELISFIDNASYIISNDTGPAHICAHLNKKGLVLFGSHTTPEKVSIESENFKPIKVNDLKDLNVSDVYEKVRQELN
ncbi:MAG: lipopolysaccharide heptosyltransferase family protein [Pelagibacteraceae bacterium TMED247]|nr:glycosyl transferase family 1 [Candidatus Pelagibacter sp.]RPG05571.1 MAG: lipopolysaccharide heptosyltransferase family protein [Pelagibacteraceae bacterium TMED247]